MRKWEAKRNTNNTGVDGKTYFKTLSTEKQTSQDDIGSGKSSFESANNAGKARSQILQLDV